MDSADNRAPESSNHLPCQPGHYVVGSGVTDSVLDELNLYPWTGAQLRGVLGNRGLAIVKVQSPAGGGRTQRKEDQVIQRLERKLKALQKQISTKNSQLVDSNLQRAALESELKHLEKALDRKRYGTERTGMRRVARLERPRIGSPASNSGTQQKVTLEAMNEEDQTVPRHTGQL